MAIHRIQLKGPWTFRPLWREQDDFAEQNLADQTGRSNLQVPNTAIAAQTGQGLPLIPQTRDGNNEAAVDSVRQGDGPSDGRHIAGQDGVGGLEKADEVVGRSVVSPIVKSASDGTLSSQLPAEEFEISSPAQRETLFQALQAEESIIPEAGTVKFPLNWETFAGPFRGCVELRRPFNRPTNLSPTTRIAVILDGIHGVSRVHLNGKTLGEVSPEAGSARFEVVDPLQLHNELRVEIQRTHTVSDPCGIWGTVCLEIQE